MIPSLKSIRRLAGPILLTWYAAAMDLRGEERQVHPTSQSDVGSLEIACNT